MLPNLRIQIHAYTSSSPISVSSTAPSTVNLLRLKTLRPVALNSSFGAYAVILSSALMSSSQILTESLCAVRVARLSQAALRSPEHGTTAVAQCLREPW